MKVLVTGATGFLGRNTLKALMGRPDVDVIAACRRPDKLPQDFKGEIRPGDLQDERYRHEVLENIDVVCNAAAWASMWNHVDVERTRFLEPTLDLIGKALKRGVKRFVQASTIAITTPCKEQEPLDDFAAARHTGFWPHLDFLVDIDRYMQEQSGQGTQMVTLRLGHFVGAGNALGLLAAYVPRMKTHLVPWLERGHKRMPLTSDTDLGDGFARAALTEGLEDYESFNICAPEFPTMLEVVDFLAVETGYPAPHYNVSYRAGHAFGWMMEKLNPVLPGDPFLTRSIVHLSESWIASTGYAQAKLGFTARKCWRTAAREQLRELQGHQDSWPRLTHPV